MGSDLGIPRAHGAMRTPRLEHWNQDKRKRKRYRDEGQADEDEKEGRRQSRRSRGGASDPSSSPPDGDDHIDFTA